MFQTDNPPDTEPGFTSRRLMRRKQRRQEQRSFEFYVFVFIALTVTAGILLGVALKMLADHNSTSSAADGSQSATPTPNIVTIFSVATPPSSPSIIPVPLPTRLITPTPDVPPSLTLKEIFPPRDLSKRDLDPQRLRTIIVTGDVVPARNVDATIRQRRDDFSWVLSATKEILSHGDLTIVNLEAPLIKNCPLHTSGFTMCGRPGFVSALKEAGVDVVTLENNHIGNYGYAGIVETTGYLKEAGLTIVDRYTPITTTVRGLKFGVIAINGVGESIDQKSFAAQIRKVRPQVDVLIAAIHWGAEYVAVPQLAAGIAPDDPIEIAHLAIDSGADLVVGNHPHWVQAVEIYKNKFIAYAHGNFVFDQMWSYETRVGVIGRYTFYDRALVRVEFVPILIEDSARPVPLQGKQAQEILDKMKVASEQMIKK